MKTTFDTDTILFGLINGSNAASAISGGVYKGERPLNSPAEDIVVNTITLTQEYFPQIGTSNVNIHVPDKAVKIKGVQQTIKNDERMKELADMVLAVIRSANIIGLKMIVETQTTIQEAELKQHFVNIRINWNIHN